MRRRRGLYSWGERIGYEFGPLFLLLIGLALLGRLIEWLIKVIRGG